MSIEKLKNFEEPIQPRVEQSAGPEKLEDSAEAFKKRFEEEFAKREYFETAGGIAETADVVPEKLKDEPPIFLVPGWACNIELYKDSLEALVKAGRRVLTINHPRRGGDMEVRSSEEERRKYPEGKLRKALDILSVMDQKNIKQADAIAHSEGAINLIIAAALHPEKFRNIVLYAPAGLIGKDTFSRLAKGFAAQSKRPDSLFNMPITEKEKADGKQVLDSLISYLKGNPLRGLKEAVEISGFQIHEMIRYLHEKGIGILVASGFEDPVFPTNRMKKIATFDKIDGFLTLPGGHGLATGEVMTQVEKMLSALESQRKKTIGGKKTDLSEEFV